MPGKRAPLEIRFFEKIIKTETCWIWNAAKDSKGYGRIGMGGRKGKDVFAHRLSYQIHRGEIPVNMLVCHKCDIPACVNPEHLFLGTQTDNMRDCVIKGRLNPFKPRGELNPKAKLNWDIVREIREKCFNSKALQKNAAQHFKVSYETIQRIIRGTSWAE